MAIQYRMNRFDVETIEGLSTDTKPPYPKEGATFRELDTDRKWIYTEREGWILIGGGGGEELVLRGVNMAWDMVYYNLKDGTITYMVIGSGMYTTPTSRYVVDLAQEGSRTIIVVNGTEVPVTDRITDEAILSPLIEDYGDPTYLDTLQIMKTRTSDTYFITMYGGYIWYAPARLEIDGFVVRISSEDPDSSDPLEVHLDCPWRCRLGYGTQDVFSHMEAATPEPGARIVLGGDQYCMVAALQRHSDIIYTSVTPGTDSKAAPATYSNEHVVLVGGDGTVTDVSRRGGQIQVLADIRDGPMEDTIEVIATMVSTPSKGSSDDYGMVVLYPSFVKPGPSAEFPWEGGGRYVPDGMWTYSVSDGVATVTGISSEWDRPEGFIAVLPDYDPDGHPVTAIGSQAFLGEARMGSFSGNVLTVGASAFADCSSLESVSLPNVTDLGVPRYTDTGNKFAFQHCTSLESVDLPSVTRVGCGTFNDCTSLREIHLPSATEIGVGAFLACSALGRIRIPASAVIWYDAFRGCDAVTYVAFGPLTTVYSDSFGSWVFYHNDSVLSITAKNLANQRFSGTASRLDIISDV